MWDGDRAHSDAGRGISKKEAEKMIVNDLNPLVRSRLPYASIAELNMWRKDYELSENTMKLLNMRKHKIEKAFRDKVQQILWELKLRKKFSYIMFEGDGPKELRLDFLFPAKNLVLQINDDEREAKESWAHGRGFNIVFLDPDWQIKKRGTLKSFLLELLS